MAKIKSNKKGEIVTKETFNEMAFAVSKYIQEAGGKAVVIGGVSIEKKDKFKFVFRVDIVGSFPLSTAKKTKK